MEKDKVYILIPCYNEEGNIGNLLQEIKNLTQNFISVVVDDCSSDNTLAEAKQEENTDILELPINLGVGGAVQTGFKYALENNAQYVVKLDGDGQHDPADIEKLLKPLKENTSDIVIGSRFLNEGQGFRSTFFRRLGIKLLQVYCRFLTGKKITDPTSGFRAYNCTALAFMANNYPSFDYPEPEEIVLATQNNLKITEISVSMREREKGESSITPLGSFYYMLKVMLSMLFIRIRKAF